MQLDSKDEQSQKKGHLILSNEIEKSLPLISSVLVPSSHFCLTKVQGCTNQLLFSLLKQISS